MTAKPTPDETDSIASYVLAVSELSAEPFFGEDEPRTCSMLQGAKPHKFHVGDRFHFRSALITFRRIWMTGEPENFERTCSILCRHGNADWRAGVGAIRKQVQDLKKRAIVWPNLVEVTGEKLVDLWLHAVFAHSGLKNQGQSRHDFDRLVEKHGQGLIEYAFRQLVLLFGASYIHLGQSAELALKQWGAAYGLTPSFTMRSAFGTSRRERTKDGSLIIRQSSSEYFSEENYDARFVRILSRSGFSGLKTALDCLEFTPTKALRLVLKHTRFEPIIRESDFELSLLTETPGSPEAFPDGARHFSTLLSPRTRIRSWLASYDTEFTTDAKGMAVLDEQLEELRKVLMS